MQLADLINFINPNRLFGSDKKPIDKKQRDRLLDEAYKVFVRRTSVPTRQLKRRALFRAALERMPTHEQSGRAIKRSVKRSMAREAGNRAYRSIKSTQTGTIE